MGDNSRDQARSKLARSLMRMARRLEKMAGDLTEGAEGLEAEAEEEVKGGDLLNLFVGSYMLAVQNGADPGDLRRAAVVVLSEEECAEFTRLTDFGDMLVDIFRRGRDPGRKDQSER